MALQKRASEALTSEVILLTFSQGSVVQIINSAFKFPNKYNVSLKNTSLTPGKRF